MSSRPARLAAVPVVIAGLALIAPQAGFGDGTEAGGKRSTTITISSSVPAFHGQVRSGSRRCESNRRVRLYRKRAGRDPKFLGRDTTSRSGRWQVRVDSLKSGAYYAKAKPKRSRGCAGARSELALID
jgi:hypothetical protein